MRSTLLLLCSSILLAACSSDDDSRDRDSGMPDAAGMIDGGAMDSGNDAGAEDTGGACETITCGPSATCCAAGDECIEDSCLSPCESGVRCGDAALCCDAGDVCVADSCEAPGAVCVDSFDCPFGEFCEPSLLRCIPQLDTIACQLEPILGDFEVVTEWSYTGPEDDPECGAPSVGTPVVIDLDGDDTPEVIAAFKGQCGESPRVIAMRGDTGEHVWEISGRVDGAGTLAAGDLDGDGEPEIVVPERSALALYSAAGTLKWRVDLPFYAAVPTLADLDGDGTAEIIVGAHVLNAAGETLWSQGEANNEGASDFSMHYPAAFCARSNFNFCRYHAGISAVADLDADGLMEVVTGVNAWRHDGTPYWTAEGVDGWPAIADFDSDGSPEVVFVGGNEIRVVDGQTGELEWGPFEIPQGGDVVVDVRLGGPPTIADFDGDGVPEIGVAGPTAYVVVEAFAAAGAEVVWVAETQDESSGATGSSVFDFEGDGAAEVVYADECSLRVYSGRDGRVLLDIPKGSGTIVEYPLIVDVDGDGNTEIVAVANTDPTDNECPNTDDHIVPGLHVFGDARDQWVRTRRIWNQHAYHVTNINDDGTIPAMEVSSWSVDGFNSYRQNRQGEGVFNAPDLRVLGVEQRIQNCPGDVLFRVRVQNEGSLGTAAGLNVSLYDDEGALVETLRTTGGLLPGATESVEFLVPYEEGQPEFVVVVDDAGDGSSEVEECDEEDNRATMIMHRCLI